MKPIGTHLGPIRPYWALFTPIWVLYKAKAWPSAEAGLTGAVAGAGARGAVTGAVAGLAGADAQGAAAGAAAGAVAGAVAGTCSRYRIGPHVKHTHRAHVKHKHKAHMGPYSTL